ncbi:MAG: carbohydrate kinase family protein [Halolamina sp.]
MTVLCAGHVNWDVTLRVERLPEPDGEVEVIERVQRGGGSAANVAAGLAGLDIPAVLFGSVGDDEMGTHALEELRDAGVDTTRLRSVPNGETAMKYLVVDKDGEVMVLSNAGRNEAFTAEHLTGGFDAIDHLHLTSQLPETAAELAKRARDAGVPVSFDPGRRLGDRDYAETIAHTDVLFLNQREAVTLVEEGDAADSLTESTAVVIKLGADGAELRGPEGVVHHGGFAVDPLDTTGAGDAFAAGFIASVRENGGLDTADFEAALELANACGAIGSCETGARAALSWDRIEQFRRTY